jgi:D-alanyl-lipoteichoic acid acyltransferase DltB (MBOAT superfamily)
MTELPIFVLLLTAYVVLALLALFVPKFRSGLFAVINITAFVWLSLFTNFTEWKNETIFSLGPSSVIRHISLIGFYVWVIAIGFFLLRGLAKREGWLPWVAFFYPISLLIGFKYFYYTSNDLRDRLGWDDWVIGATIVGLSYMAFRLSYLVLEVRNGIVEMPRLSEYLGFAFFLPTLVVGPINPFSVHQKSLEVGNERSVPVGRALLRVLVGATKFFFLGNLANQLTYSGILFDGNRHSFLDLGIAVIFYYIFLFLNFSGFCDMAIGLAALLGVRVKENFDNPFAARNVKEFWNRWHITLSEYTRDVIFTPVTKGMVKKLGVRYTNLSISVAVLCVFLVIGVWHGVGIFFVIFGLIHAVGVISNHYYTVWLKRMFGKERYKAYNENRLVNAVAIALTFSYVAISFAAFANSYSRFGMIRNALFA